MRTLALIFLCSVCLADSQHYGPTYDSRRTNLEFTNIYKEMPIKSTTPQVFIGAGAPSFTPTRTADIYVSTTTGKVYIATTTANSGGWAVLN